MVPAREMTETSPRTMIEFVDGDADAGAGQRLLAAMTDEIDELYHDREGSIHDISASTDGDEPAPRRAAAGARGWGGRGLRRPEAT